LIVPYRESGIVLDIGTGDGRFVTASAKGRSDKFFIGIDANAKPLEKLATKVTRKPAKGGLANAMFVQAAVENLPEEFNGVASEIHINFPWGSLLRAVAVGEPKVLESLRNILAPLGSLNVTIGVDPTRDQAEMVRLGIKKLDIAYIDSDLRTAYDSAGLEIRDRREISMPEWSQLETSWARKLGGNDDRRVFRLSCVRN
jgi:16S rRNA (adenine(1408)-N(1))-methyltransferase